MDICRIELIAAESRSNNGRIPQLKIKMSLLQ